MRVVSPSAGPQRIVCLVPSSTESIAAFGAASRLVGCTRYCTEPARALQGVARIGGTKNPDREQILALAPDLVVANAEENRPDDLEWLRARVPVLVQTPCTVAEAVAALRELATVLAAEAVAAALLARIAQVAVAAPPPSAVQRVFCAVWRKPWMGANETTFLHDVLRHCGAANVCAGAAARYPEVDPADLVARGLDCVLLPSEPWAFDAAQRDQLAAARTFGAARLLLCDGRDLTWHGVHMAVGLPRAMALLRGGAVAT